MHQIRFRLGLRPRPRWGSLQRSSRPLAGFEGLLLREGREKGWDEREGREEKAGEGREEGRGGEWRGEEAFLVVWPRRLSALNPPLAVLRLLLILTPAGNCGNISITAPVQKALQQSQPWLLCINAVYCHLSVPSLRGVG